MVFPPEDTSDQLAVVLGTQEGLASGTDPR